MPDSCYPLPLTILEEKFKASKGFKWNSGKSQRLGGWGGTGTDSNAAETWVLLWMCWVVCGTKVPPGERS